MDARGGKSGCQPFSDGSGDNFLSDVKSERERHEPWCLMNTGGVCSCSADEAFKPHYSEYKSPPLYEDSAPFRYSDTSDSYFVGACQNYPISSQDSANDSIPQKFGYEEKQPELEIENDQYYSHNIEDNNNVPNSYHGIGCPSCEYNDQSRYPNYSYNDQIDSELLVNQARVQVTAKVLFGSVSAISTLKQKKSSKKK